jgi:hypothetical protein
MIQGTLWRLKIWQSLVGREIVSASYAVTSKITIENFRHPIPTIKSNVGRGDRLDRRTGEG